jgi:hypothetical protein
MEKQELIDVIVLVASQKYFDIYEGIISTNIGKICATHQLKIVHVPQVISFVKGIPYYC